MASIRLPLGDAPTDLRAPLREATGTSFRRINRFIELALLGAARCAANASAPPPPDTALLLAHDIGMLTETLRVIDGMARHDRVPTPFEFMNLSGTMAGFQVAQHLRLRGPQLTLHRNHASLEAALQLLSLDSAPQRRALVGVVEEGCWPLAEQRERLRWPQGMLAESSHWLYFDADAIAPLATIRSCTQHASLDALAASLPADERDALWLCGCERSRNTAPLHEWAARLGIAKVFEPISEPLHSGGLSSDAICAFVQRHPGQRLLHVNRTAQDEFYAIRL